MLRQGMPRIEGEILGQRITVRCGEDLLWDRDCRHLMKGGMGFRPFVLGISDAHCVRGTRLDHKVEFSVTLLQLVDHRLAKEVRIGLMWKLRFYRVAWHCGKLDRLLVWRVTEPVWHRRPIADR